MTIVYGLISLCILVFIHETGHFAFAKLFGVKVESFSVGMGPIIFHKTIRGTDYRLSLLPLGGYCGMKGEQDFTKALESGSKNIDAESDSLYGVFPLKRALIAFAGPFFNFIFAVITLSVVAMLGSYYYSASSKITLADEIYPEVHSSAREAGLKTGDTILEINGNKINDFSDIFTYVSICPDEDVLVKVDRNGEILDFSVHVELDKENGIGKIGVANNPESVEKKIIEPLPFFKAFGKGFKDSCNLIYISLKSIKILFKGVNISNSVSGPARITTMIGNTVQEGFSIGIKEGFGYTLNFMALISVSLFIMNLLPIPILDGGLILFSLIESFTKRQVPPKVQYYVQYVGLAFIILLTIIGVFGDIQYFISGASSK